MILCLHENEFYQSIVFNDFESRNKSFMTVNTNNTVARLWFSLFKICKNNTVMIKLLSKTRILNVFDFFNTISKWFFAKNTIGIHVYKSNLLNDLKSKKKSKNTLSFSNVFTSNHISPYSILLNDFKSKKKSKKTLVFRGMSLIINIYRGNYYGR